MVTGVELTTDNAKSWTKAKTLEMARWVEDHFEIEGFASKLILRISTAPSRKRSWGGRKWKGGYQVPYMSLSLRHRLMMMKNGASRFQEYALISKHPVIGTIENTTPDVMITALIAHEMAHAIDYCTRGFGSPVELAALVDNKIDLSIANHDGRARGHGARWQAIYAVLRVQFVNNGVTNPVCRVKDEVAKGRTRKNKVTINTARQYIGSGRTAIGYYYNDVIVAVGVSEKFSFRIWPVDENKARIGGVEYLNNGRLARRWVMDNIVNK